MRRPDASVAAAICATFGRGAASHPAKAKNKNAPRDTRGVRVRLISLGEGMGLYTKSTDVRSGSEAWQGSAHLILDAASSWQVSLNATLAKTQLRRYLQL
jgi:hypothetical protein